MQRSHRIETVSIKRGRTGYGFTVSGHNPCRLGGIAEGGAAEQAGLQVGDIVLGINGYDVSKASHDDVIRRIGMSRGLLTLTIGEEYSSDASSEDDSLDFEIEYYNRVASSKKTDQPRPSPLGEPNTCTTSEWTKPDFISKYPATAALVHTERDFASQQGLGIQSDYVSRKLRRSEFDVLNSAPSKSSDREALGMQYKHTVIKRQARLDHEANYNTLAADIGRSSPDGCNGNASDQHHGEDSAVMLSNDMQVIVSYSGSVEMPSDAPRLAGSRLQSIRAAVQRLRSTRNSNRTVVLMNINSDGIRLADSTRQTVANYVTECIAFCGICPDDRRYFGIVMTPAWKERERQTVCGTSCHVFMVDAELCDHRVHSATAAHFGINCTMDLDTDCCLEFPRSATPIISFLGQLYRQRKIAGRFFAPVSGMLGEPKINSGVFVENGKACVIDTAVTRSRYVEEPKSFIHDLSMIQPASHVRVDDDNDFENDGLQSSEENGQHFFTKSLHVGRKEGYGRQVTAERKHAMPNLMRSLPTPDDVNSSANMRRSVRRFFSAEQHQKPTPHLSVMNDNQSAAVTGQTNPSVMQPPPLPPKKLMPRSISGNVLLGRNAPNKENFVSETPVSSGLKVSDVQATSSSSSKPPLPVRKPLSSQATTRILPAPPRRELVDRPKSTPPVDTANELTVAVPIDLADYDSDPGEQKENDVKKTSSQVRMLAVCLFG